MTHLADKKVSVAQWGTASFTSATDCSTRVRCLMVSLIRGRCLSETGQPRPKQKRAIGLDGYSVV
jgi:hypothetical protein